MRRILATVLATTLVGSAAVGAASSLDLDASPLSAGSAAISSCDADGIVVTYDLAWRGHFAIDRVIIGGIDDACIGLEIELVLVVDGVGVGLGGPPVSATEPDANVATISVPVDVRALDLDSVEIAIT